MPLIRQSLIGVSLGAAKHTCQLQACIGTSMQPIGAQLPIGSRRTYSPSNDSRLNPAIQSASHPELEAMWTQALNVGACCLWTGTAGRVCLAPSHGRANPLEEPHQCAADLLRSPFGSAFTSGFSKRMLLRPSRSQICETWSLISTISPPASFSSPANSSCYTCAKGHTALSLIP